MTEKYFKAHLRRTPNKVVFDLSCEKVYHAKFGNGTIVSIDGEGNNTAVWVAFEQGGIRSFAAELAPLKKYSFIWKGVYGTYEYRRTQTKG